MAAAPDSANSENRNLTMTISTIAIITKAAAS